MEYLMPVPIHTLEGILSSPKKPWGIYRKYESFRWGTKKKMVAEETVAGDSLINDSRRVDKNKILIRCSSILLIFE